MKNIAVNHADTQRCRYELDSISQNMGHAEYALPVHFVGVTCKIPS